jgi:uncharacterized protein
MSDWQFYRIKMAIIGVAIIILIDLYTYQAVRIISGKFPTILKNLARGGYWTVTLLSVGILAWINLIGISNEKLNQWIVIWLAILYFSKFILVLVLFLDDLRRGMHFTRKYFRKKSAETPDVTTPRISRSEFFARASIVAGSIPLATLSFGILSGAHNFRVRRQLVYLPNLPKAFDGMQIGQLSDIHAGSLFNRKAILGGLELLMAEKPDVIFFTGDLVNAQTREVNDYVNIFDKLKAPLGVFSVTGNHDYGNYARWPNEQAKRKNFEDLLLAHKQMGFDLLMNENRFLEISGEKIAILGVENWGVGPPLRFPKYGKLNEAHANTEEAAVKILLSHDPSHWDAQIRPEYSDIDLTFSGHTHGYQMGVTIAGYTWSPAQYRFKQWAGLYKEGNQYLYVNRGFGCIGYPGRIGMPPELTVVELKSGNR